MSVKTKQNFRLKQFSPYAAQFLRNTAEQLQSIAVHHAPVDTGNLQTSIEVIPRAITKNTKRVTIWPRGVPYARIQEFGGVIKPKRKPLLAWAIKGKKNKYGKQAYAFAKQVTIKPKRYMQKTRDRADSVIDAEFSKAFKAYIRSLSS